MDSARLFRRFLRGFLALLGLSQDLGSLGAVSGGPMFRKTCEKHIETHTYKKFPFAVLALLHLFCRPSLLIFGCSGTRNRAQFLSKLVQNMVPLVVIFWTCVWHMFRANLGSELAQIWLRSETQHQKRSPPALAGWPRAGAGF